MTPGNDKCHEKNEPRQGMEEDIFIRYSGKAFSGKMIIVWKPEEYQKVSSLATCRKNTLDSENTKFEDPESDNTQLFEKRPMRPVWLDQSK